MTAGDERFADTFDPEETDRAYDDGPIRRRTEMPMFSKVMLIIDMFLCGLRALLVVFSVAGLKMLPADNPLTATVVWEIAAGAGIAVFGLSGDLLLLLKKPWAMGLAWLSVLCTLVATAVGVWTLSLLAEPMAGNGQAQQIGFWVGGSMTLVIRLGILAVFVAALVFYSKWARQLPQDI